MDFDITGKMEPAIYPYLKSDIKTKRGKDVLQGLKTIFKDGFKVNMVRTDRGMEFHSKEVNAYLKSQNVHHFYALNTEMKANYAERLIKTLKHKLFRYMMGSIRF